MRFDELLKKIDTGSVSMVVNFVLMSNVFCVGADVGDTIIITSYRDDESGLWLLGFGADNQEVKVKAPRHEELIECTNTQLIFYSPLKRMLEAEERKILHNWKLVEETLEENITEEQFLKYREEYMRNCGCPMLFKEYFPWKDGWIYDSTRIGSMEFRAKFL